MAWPGNEFEDSMPNTRTQTTSRNLLLQTYMYAAGLATWGVGPDVIKLKIIIEDVLRTILLITSLSHYTYVCVLKILYKPMVCRSAGHP